MPFCAWHWGPALKKGPGGPGHQGAPTPENSLQREAKGHEIPPSLLQMFTESSIGAGLARPWPSVKAYPAEVQSTSLQDPHSAFFPLISEALLTGGSLSPESPPSDCGLPEGGA